MFEVGDIVIRKMDYLDNDWAYMSERHGLTSTSKHEVTSSIRGCIYLDKMGIWSASRFELYVKDGKRQSHLPRWL